MAGSNYEVNIKLNLKSVNKQLNNLEKRISRINKLAQGGRASKTVNKNEKDRLTAAVKLTRQEQRTLRIKQKQLKVDQQQLKVEKATAVAVKQQTKLSTPKGKNFGEIGGSIGPALPPKSKPQRGGGLTSALISGAFPLLFGQGPLAAAGGFTGGLIGDKLGGQMGGFAGGLIGTATITAIQGFTVETGKLGAALNDNTKDVSALSSALGITGTEFEKNLKIIERLGGEEAAFALARERMINLVGQDGVDALTKFGDEFTKLGNNFAKIMTLMKSSFAKFLEESGIGKFISQTVENSALLRQADQSENKDIQELVKLKNLVSSPMGTVKDQQEAGKKVGIDVGRFGFRDPMMQAQVLDLLNAQIIAEQKLVNKKKDKVVADKTSKDLITASLKSTTDNILVLQETLQFGQQEAAVRQKIREIEEETKETLSEKEKIRIRTNMHLETSLQKQLEFSQAIGQSFKDNFKDAILGAQTFGEAMRNVLNNISNRLLDMALDQAFSNAGGGIFGFLGNIFGNKKKIPERAKGGPVQGGRSFVVGEKGPELFTPKSTGMITPNHALGGSTNIVVNVDASGSNVEGDEQGGRELGRLISSAVQSEIVQQQRPGGLLA